MSSYLCHRTTYRILHMTEREADTQEGYSLYYDPFKKLV